MSTNGLQYDPEAAVQALTTADPLMGELIHRAGPFTLVATGIDRSPFWILMRSIVFQQLSGRVASAIYGRVVALLPDDAAEHPQALLSVPEPALRAAGLSQNKVRAVLDLAEKTQMGVVPASTRELETMSDDDIVEHLTQVRGIGRWTVEMLLLFHMGRPDVFPIHDLGVRKGYQLTYGGDDMPAPKKLEILGEKWRPYRSVASWYLWRAVDLTRPAQRD